MTDFTDFKLPTDAERDAHKLLPHYMVQSMLDYWNKRIPPGGFLRSVLANDLVGAVGHADETNKASICNYVQWLYWNVPARPTGWGSYKAVDKWLSQVTEHTDD